MSFGFQLLSWRRHRQWTQAQLAEKVGTPRPYLSRLEMDQVDPSLSLVRRIAISLGITLVQLLETLPPHQTLSNAELDLAARQALQPGLVSDSTPPYVGALSRLLKDRRAAIHARKSNNRKKRNPNTGIHALRRLRADLGEQQWQALLQRVDKHSPFIGKNSHED
ncbi:MAG: helix-turn-helix domain-containing protein [Elusimicrobiota bacterium]